MTANPHVHTLEQWQALVGKIRLSDAFPIRVTQEVRCGVREGFEILTTLSGVVDVVSGKPTTVRRIDIAHEGESLAGAVHKLVAAIRAIVLHEVEENVMFNGRLLADPHLRFNEQCPEHSGDCRITAVERGEPRPRYKCSSKPEFREGAR